MIQFYGYTFVKRRNSTKIVDTGAIIGAQCALKEETSINNPTFLLAVGAGDVSSLFKINYAKVLDHYYFVQDITAVSATHFAVTCEIDALATYKDEILSTSAFCLYDTVDNTEIPDQRLSIRTSATTTSSTTAFPWSMESQTYVLSVIGDDSIDNFFIYSLATLQALYAKMDEWFTDAYDGITEPNYEPYTGTEWENIVTLGKNTVMSLKYFGEVVWGIGKQGVTVGSAADNIKGCVYLPFGGTHLGDWKTIKLGAYDSGIQAQTVSEARETRTASVSIPWQASDWRRRSPYTEIYLSLPFIGVISLSADSLVGNTSLNVIFELNWLSGCLCADVVALPAGRHIGRFTANCGGTVSIGASNASPVSVANSVASLATGTSTGLASGLINLANSLTPQGNSVCGNSGGVGGYDTVGVYCVYHGSTVEPSSISDVCGTPSCAVRSLGSLSGYVQTQGASVAISGHADEADKINSLLDGGVYIE